MSPGNPSFGTWIASTRRALVALACLAPLVGLVLPLQAEAQTTFVSNTGQSDDIDTRPVGVGGFNSFWTQAQRFTTGSNEAGYTLSAIDVLVHEFKSASSPRVSIYTVTSGNPGTSLYVLTNPATLVDGAINTFTAPANATLAKDTDYFVVFDETGTGSSAQYVLNPTFSNAEDAGKASGPAITDPGRTFLESSRSPSREPPHPSSPRLSRRSTRWSARAESSTTASTSSSRNPSGSRIGTCATMPSTSRTAPS